MISSKFLKIFVIFVIFVGILLFWNAGREIKGIMMGGKMFFVEVSKTPAEQERGLSGHKPLLDNQGMLFVFQKPDFYSFWMKDMLFPLDMVWIDSNLRVVSIEKNVLPDSYPTAFTPNAKSLYVLEISAGQVDSLNVKMGDTVKFIKK